MPVSSPVSSPVSGVLLGMVSHSLQWKILKLPNLKLNTLLYMNSALEKFVFNFMCIHYYMFSIKYKFFKLSLKLSYFLNTFISFHVNALHLEKMDTVWTNIFGIEYQLFWKKLIQRKSILFRLSYIGLAYLFWPSSWRLSPSNEWEIKLF